MYHPSHPLFSTVIDALNQGRDIGRDLTWIKCYVYDNGECVKEQVWRESPIPWRKVRGRVGPRRKWAGRGCLISLTKLAE